MQFQLFSQMLSVLGVVSTLASLVAHNSDRWYVRRLQRQELRYFEVVGVVFRTVVVAVR